MISSFLIALREGLEAALVVGIVLVYLRRTSRAHLIRFVWAGVGLAVALSLAVALALERWAINEDGFEGVMLLAAAFFVVTMIVWMNRMARTLRTHIEQRVESYMQKSEFTAGLGIGTFVFLMVLREGAELALILKAVELSSAGLAVWIGTLLGLAVAVAVGWFFFEGTLKIPIGRFFSATSIILIVVAVQLAITGLHEMSEAQWLPSSKEEMAIVGPIVSNEVFFFVVVLGVALLVVLREWLTPPQRPAAGAAGQAPSQAPNQAEARRLAWERRKQRRWMMGAAALFVAVILALTGEFVYAREAAAPPDAPLLMPQGNEVHVALANIGDGNLHFFRTEVSDTSVRFIVVRKPDGSWGTALDACAICGWAGYRQNGSNMICRNCSSAIYIPTIGQTGGCNPVPLPSHVEGQDLAIDLSALANAARNVPH